MSGSGCAGHFHSNAHSARNSGRNDLRRSTTCTAMKLAQSYKSAKIKIDELLSETNRQLENNRQEIDDIRIKFKKKEDMNQNVSEDGIR